MIEVKLHTKPLASYVALVTLLFSCCSPPSRQADNSVKVVGAMNNVMWEGEVQGTIDLDTISNKKHLYGLGPLEYLTGEILIVDGTSYKSTVVSDSTMKVEETFNAQAPFFVYANVERWREQNLPDSVQNIPQLEAYLDQARKNSRRPFAFRLVGAIESATMHVVNLPKGSEVHSPEDSHKGQHYYQLHNDQSEIVGFFSTEHKGVFTHHDTFLHMHLITANKSRMGHLDDARFARGAMKLYLPNE